MRVLVTGGNGALGSEICHQLQAKGHSVLSIDRDHGRQGSVEHHVADLTGYDEVAPLFRNVEGVVHTAALHGLHLLEGCGDTQLFTTNVQGLHNVLTACAEHGIRRLVFTSSASIYGVSANPDLDRAVWLDEAASTYCSDIYDSTKLIGEQLCQSFAQSCVLQVVSLRPTRFHFDDRISYNLRKLWRGVDLRDAAQAHVCGLFAMARAPFRVYNVAADSPFRPADCAALFNDAREVIEAYYPGIADFFARQGWQLPERIDRVFDIGRARDELGYRPRFNFDEFLSEAGFKSRAPRHDSRRVKA